MAAGIYQHWQVAGAPVGDAASFKETISSTQNEAPSPVPEGTSTTPSRTDLALVLILLALIIDLNSLLLEEAYFISKHLFLYCHLLITANSWLIWNKPKQYDEHPVIWFILAYSLPERASDIILWTCSAVGWHWWSSRRACAPCLSLSW